MRADIHCFGPFITSGSPTLLLQIFFSKNQGITPERKPAQILNPAKRRADPAGSFPATAHEDVANQYTCEQNNE